MLCPQFIISEFLTTFICDIFFNQVNLRIIFGIYRVNIALLVCTPSLTNANCNACVQGLHVTEAPTFVAKVKMSYR